MVMPDEKNQLKGKQIHKLLNAKRSQQARSSTGTAPHPVTIELLAANNNLVVLVHEASRRRQEIQIRKEREKQKERKKIKSGMIRTERAGSDRN